MYKILLADDEGIVLESLRFIIERHFKGEFIIETAKSGRQVIELAESFYPDIAIVDIQMAGINGIEAMREIRKKNEQIILIVLTAYDIFDYAKQSVNLGVMEYLNKPIQRTEIVTVLEKAMQKVNEKRELRQKELVNLEQMESLKPILESCFIDGILMEQGQNQRTRSLQESLGMNREYGYFLVIHFEMQEGQNEIGSLRKIQGDAPYLREQIKSLLLRSDKRISDNDIAVGSFIQCRIPILVGVETKEEWGEHQKAIRNMHLVSLEKKLAKRYSVPIRFGVGKHYSLEEVRNSYYGALKAIEQTDETICYQQGFQQKKMSDPHKLSILEQQIQNAVMEGALQQCRELASVYISLWHSNGPNDHYNLKLKILEVVLLAEKQVYEPAQLTAREDYLTSIQKLENQSELKIWFLKKLEEICHVALRRKEENSKSIVLRGKEYIEQNFQKDISLTDIAKELNISPHYFSRVFKEKVGMNYIEYLTSIRIAYAKKSLLESKDSIQTICNASGYADPNYFSRIFKKNVGMTPSEYKEGRPL